VFKYDPAYLNEEEFKPFKLDKSYFYDDEKINVILYNQSFTKMYSGTDEGTVLVFPVVAETFDFEEEEPEQDKEGE